MVCKKCGAFLSDDLTECPICGAPVEQASCPCEHEESEIDETDSPVSDSGDISESSEEIADELPDDVVDGDYPAPESEELPLGSDDEKYLPKEKKNHSFKGLCIVLAVLLIISAAFNVILSKDSIKKSVFGAVSEIFSSDKSDEVIAELNGKTLTNQQLGYYYYTLYDYLKSVYGDYLSSIIDPTVPLSEQMYSEGESWQDYFVNASIDTWSSTVLLSELAENDGFELSENDIKNLDEAESSIEQAATAEGFGSIDEYLKSHYGKYADFDSYMEYTRESVYSNSFYTKKFDELHEKYSNEPISDDNYAVSVRHILLQVEDAEDTASWDAAKAKADEIYALWKDGVMSEERFAELADEHTEDPGSKGLGGLYTDVQQGQMVPAFNDWCFDKARQPGDNGIVKTEYGYHIMYFIEKTNAGSYDKAQTEISEWLDAQMASVSVEKHLEKVFVG